ncbi:MAG: HesA/MoeB/ThiF family protein [Mucilaginibacter polytrichastri]|nr:HesA/MoeB/ThiF family protein [Mucilaginibacter polytrichastri]
MYNERYQRQIFLTGFGPEAQQKLWNARVLVVGAGGLGVPVLQYLTAMGVGHIGIIDDDLISLSNLHRQVIYAHNEIGMSKVRVIEAKLAAQNPDIRFLSFQEMLTEKNATDIISRFDVVVDATDNFAARYLISDTCVELKKPFVYGAVQGFEGQVSVFNFDGGPTYRSVFPEMPAPDQIPDCNVNGVLGVVPGIVGTYQALEVVKIITGIGSPLSGILQIFDFLSNEHYAVKIRSGQSAGTSAAPENENHPVIAPVARLSPAELITWYQQEKIFMLFDIREPAEFDEMHLENARLFSMNRLLLESDQLIPDNSIAVIMCKRGLRSEKAAALLAEKHPASRIFHLQEGMDGWQKTQGRQFLVL